MKLIASMAALGALAVSSPAAAQQGGAQAQAQPAAPKVKVSAKAGAAIAAFQQAVNANDTANIPAKLAAAQAVAQTKDDRYAIASLQLKAALAANDNNAAAAAVDAIAASGFVDAATTAKLYSALGVTLYNAKQYPQAATVLSRAVTMSPNNPEPLTLLAEAQNAQGQKAEAANTLMKVIQLSASSGQKPAEDVYKRALSLAYEAKAPNAVDIGRQWIAAYPSPQSWRNAIAIYRNYNQPDVESTLDLLRVMRAAKALTMATDYRLYATAAAEQLNFNEAQAILDEGIQAKIVNPASADFRDVITPLKAKAKATPADLAEATKTAQSGKALLGIGDRYYAMGDYAKAVELYKMAQGKPGVDPAIANLHLGMGLAMAGDKAGATAALNAVTGPRADVAKYWLLYVQRG
jgi:tetratricopeptide (TPR) repeat protein